MVLKIFTQPNCPKCPAAKELGKRLAKHLKVEFFDTDTVDGMAEGAFYQVMSTPTVLLCDNKGLIVETWRGKVPKEKKILKVLSRKGKRKD